MPINTIVFDLGGVLIDWNPRYLYRKHISDEQHLEWFLTTVCNDDWNLQQDKGRTFAEGVHQLQQVYPQYREQIALYHKGWQEMLAGPIPASVDLLRQLTEGPYRLLALTNWSNETFPIAQARFPFLQWFESILVSGIEKMIKPEPEIFHLLQCRYKLIPTNCLFIDDNLKNIRAAESMGFRVHHFQSPELLEQQLKDLEIL